MPSGTFSANALLRPLGISHTFLSDKTDGGDASKVKASNWDAAHTVTSNSIPPTALILPLNTVSGSVNTRDDEFDVGSGIDGKWTLYGNAVTTTEVNVSPYYGSLHLYRSDTGSKISIYGQSLPSLPTTIYSHVGASSQRANYSRGGGIAILPSSPTDSSAAVYLGPLYENAQMVEAVKYSNLSTFSSTVFSTQATLSPLGIWLKMVINSATSVDFYWSINGHFWTTGATAYNPSFTPAVGGVAFSPEGASLEAAWSWIRFR